MLVITFWIPTATRWVSRWTSGVLAALLGLNLFPVNLGQVETSSSPSPWTSAQGMLCYSALRPKVLTPAVHFLTWLTSSVLKYFLKNYMYCSFWTRIIFTPVDEQSYPSGIYFLIGLTQTLKSWFIRMKSCGSHVMVILYWGINQYIFYNASKTDLW